MSSESIPAWNPRVFWLFGLSGAGKSTLADRAATALRARGIAVLTLDGDRVRTGLSAGLSFTDEGRQENLRRAAEVAKLGLESGLCVIASFITPYKEHRWEIARIVGVRDLRFVYVHAPLELCWSRDVKGLYARASTGNVPQFTGLTSRFDLPMSADITLDTTANSVEASTDQLLHYMSTEFRF